jgi:hypothetical protein
VPLKTRLRLSEAAGYLAVAPTVVRVAVDAPIEQSGPDAVPHTPADPERVLELAERWNLGKSVERLLAALPGNQK